jgi:hypothetical protein
MKGGKAAPIRRKTDPEKAKGVVYALMDVYGVKVKEVAFERPETSKEAKKEKG